MAVRAVQQIMIGSVCRNEEETRKTLQAIKHAGFDGIELNRFMINPTPFLVRVLTKAAGMPVGKGQKLNWKQLLKEADLRVVSLHTDLGSLKKDMDAVIAEAKHYETDTLVITGMYRFDYADVEKLKELVTDLNTCGKKLKEQGLRLLYHNHNIELLKISEDQTAFDYIVENTDPEYVNFELDSYWLTEAGASAISIMKKLGDRMKLYHIADRGTRCSKTPMTPILKSDSVELGTGNINLEELIEQALKVQADAIVLESHKNWIDKSPVKSIKISGEYLKRKM